MKMRTMVVAGTGYESLQLEERDVPTPGAGEIVVRIHAATLNYRDWLMLHAQSTSGRIPAKTLSTSSRPGFFARYSDAVCRINSISRSCATGSRTGRSIGVSVVPTSV